MRFARRKGAMANVRKQRSQEGPEGEVGMSSPEGVGWKYYSMRGRKRSGAGI